MYTLPIMFKAYQSQFWEFAFSGVWSKKQWWAKANLQKWQNVYMQVPFVARLQSRDSKFLHHDTHEWESSCSATMPSLFITTRVKHLYIYIIHKWPTRGQGFAFSLSVVAICIQKCVRRTPPKKIQNKSRSQKHSSPIPKI